MKKVLLHGYTMDNLGDDLFFQVLVNRYPNVQFYLPTLNCNYKSKFKFLKNLKVVDFFGVSKFTKHQVYKLPKLYSKYNMSKFDAVVCIGGSLFIDCKNANSKDRYVAENYSFIADWKYAEENNVPYYVIGANWGPCYNQYYYDYFNNAFDSLADLCFRDTYSYEIFKDKKNVRHTGDILMGNDYIKKSIGNCSKKRQIAISIVDSKHKSEEFMEYDEYERKITEFCEEFSKLNYSIVLLSFCEKEGDLKVAERIYSQINDKSSIRIINYKQNYAEMLQILAESEFIVASRFHATVLGWTLGTKVYSVVYGKKTIHLIQDCGYDHGYIGIEKIDELTIDTILKESVCPENVLLYEGSKAFYELDKVLKES